MNDARGQRLFSTSVFNVRPFLFRRAMFVSSFPSTETQRCLRLLLACLLFFFSGGDFKNFFSSFTPRRLLPHHSTADGFSSFLSLLFLFRRRQEKKTNFFLLALRTYDGDVWCELFFFLRHNDCGECDGIVISCTVSRNLLHSPEPRRDQQNYYYLDHGINGLSSTFNVSP